MVVFEISVNGQRAFVMGNENLGMLTATIMHWDGQDKAGAIHQDTRLNGRGAAANGSELAEWPTKVLRVGDEVLIRIVDSTTFDKPAERIDLNNRVELASKATLAPNPPKWEL
jgi:hypothetical protein